MPPLTPIVRPGSYFEEREVDGLHVLAVIAMLVAAGPIAVYGAGWILTVHVDGTVLLDNPERPPDRVCDAETGAVDRTGCDQPRRVERDVDSAIWTAMDDVLVPALVAGPIVLLLTGLLLHVGSWLAGGENGVPLSFVVAAWGLVPSLLGVIVGVIALYVTIEPVTVTPGNGATARDAVRAQLETLRQATTATTLLTTVWGAVIWRYGLQYERGLDGAPAWTVAGIVAAVLAGLVLL